MAVEYDPKIWMLHEIITAVEMTRIEKGIADIADEAADIDERLSETITSLTDYALKSDITKNVLIDSPDYDVEQIGLNDLEFCMVETTPAVTFEWFGISIEGNGFMWKYASGRKYLLVVYTEAFQIGGAMWDEAQGTTAPYVKNVINLTNTVTQEELTEVRNQITAVQTSLEQHKASGDHDTRYYTQDEVDNLIANVVQSLQWHAAVETFADLATTYPDALVGWTVAVQDENTVYRYDGTAWVDVFHLILNIVTAENDGLMTSEMLASLEKAVADILTKADLVHRSATWENGQATAELASHVKLGDEAAANLDSTEGIAATPKAVYDMGQAANAYTEEKLSEVKVNQITGLYRVENINGDPNSLPFNGTSGFLPVYVTASAGTPVNIATIGYIIKIAQSAYKVSLQISMDETGKERLFTRFFSNGSWGTWKEMDLLNNESGENAVKVTLEAGELIYTQSLTDMVVGDTNVILYTQEATTALLAYAGYTVTTAGEGSVERISDTEWNVFITYHITPTSNTQYPAMAEIKCKLTQLEDGTIQSDRISYAAYARQYHATPNSIYGAASATNYGHVKLVNSITSTSTGDAATANSVRLAVEASKTYTDEQLAAIAGENGVYVNDAAWIPTEENTGLKLNESKTIRLDQSFVGPVTEEKYTQAFLGVITRTGEQQYSISGIVTTYDSSFKIFPLQFIYAGVWQLQESGSAEDITVTGTAFPELRELAQGQFRNVFLTPTATQAIWGEGMSYPGYGAVQRYNSQYAYFVGVCVKYAEQNVVQITGAVNVETGEVIEQKRFDHLTTEQADQLFAPKIHVSYEFAEYGEGNDNAWGHVKKASYIDDSPESEQDHSAAVSVSALISYIESKPNTSLRTGYKMTSTFNPFENMGWAYQDDTEYQLVYTDGSDNDGFNPWDVPAFGYIEKSQSVGSYLNYRLTLYKGDGTTDKAERTFYQNTSPFTGVWSDWLINEGQEAQKIVYARLQRIGVASPFSFQNAAGDQLNLVITPGTYTLELYNGTPIQVTVAEQSVTWVSDAKLIINTDTGVLETGSVESVIGSETKFIVGTCVWTRVGTVKAVFIDGFDLVENIPSVINQSVCYMLSWGVTTPLIDNADGTWTLAAGTYQVVDMGTSQQYSITSTGLVIPFDFAEVLYFREGQSDIQVNSSGSLPDGARIIGAMNRQGGRDVVMINGMESLTVTNTTE